MPRLPGFCGGAYQGRSITADAQRCLNLFPEQSLEKNQLVLIGTPGISLFATLSDSPVRCFHLTRGRLFVVSGGTLYELSSDGTATVRGTVSRSGHASITSNGVELFITTGGGAYIYTLETNLLSAPNIPGKAMGAFVDGYFVGLQGASQQVWLSGLYDGAAWDGLDFTSAEGNPDLAKHILPDHRELVIFGEESTEFFYNSGDPDMPIWPNRGAFVEQGIGAPWSAVKMDNSIFMIGGGSRGAGIAWRFVGYQPQRISTHPVEAAWASYSTISDAVGYAYEDEGHSFWVIWFPTIDKTWCYDAATGLWHERGWWDKVHATMNAHRSSCHIYAFGQHLVGDRENGNVYTQSLDTYTDNGDELRRIRVTPHLAIENKRIYNSLLEVHAEVGVGLSTGQGSDPQMMMRHSDDGGKTWSNERWAPLGKIGQYKNRCRWHRLGSGRDRVYEISCSEPTKQVWIDAYIE